MQSRTDPGSSMLCRPRIIVSLSCQAAAHRQPSLESHRSPSSFHRWKFPDMGPLSFPVSPTRYRRRVSDVPNILAFGSSLPLSHGLRHRPPPNASSTIHNYPDGRMQQESANVGPGRHRNEASLVPLVDKSAYARCNAAYSPAFRSPYAKFHLVCVGMLLLYREGEKNSTEPTCRP